MKLKVMFLVMLIILSALFASCSKPETEEEWEPPKKEEAVSTDAPNEQEPETKKGGKSIDFILMGYGGTGQPRNKDLIKAMLDVLNGRLAKEIDAELSLTWLPYETYKESVLEMIASDGSIDAVDIIYQHSSTFYSLMEKDMLMDIKDDFKIYMPKTYALLYEKYVYLDDYLLTGDAQYIIPKIDAYPMRSYIITPKDIYDEYGKKIATLEDYEEYMQWISETKPEMAAGYAEPIDVIDTYLTGHGYAQSFATSLYCTLEKYNEVVPMERAPEFRDVYEMLARWNEKKYQGTVRSGGQFMAAQSGKLASMLVGIMSSSANNQEITLPTDVQYEYIVLYRESKMMCVPSFGGLSVLNQADGAPETLMFFELINNEQDYYDMLQYGLEDVNYRKIGEKLTLPEQTSKSIMDWYGSDNFYNYTMERSLWSEPDDFEKFFEDLSFYNMVTPKELTKELSEGEAEAIDQETVDEINRLYEEGISPLLETRWEVYWRFLDRLSLGDYTMSTDEAIEMLEEGKTQELVDTYEAIQELEYPAS